MSVLIKQLITEKITEQNEVSKFGFVVALGANKVEIKKEVEKLYGVNVLSVRTAIQAGKPKHRYTKSSAINGKTPKFKKALVTLAEGEFIDFYSGI